MIFVCVIKICFGGVYQVATSQTKDSSCLRQIARRSGDRGEPLSPFSCYSSFSLGFTYNLGLGVFYICLYQNNHAINSWKNKLRSYLLSTTWSNFFQSLPFQSLFLLLDSSQVPIFYLQSSRCCFLLADFPPLAASLLVEFPSLFYIAESSSFFQLSLFFY